MRQLPHKSRTNTELSSCLLFVAFLGGSDGLRHFLQPGVKSGFGTRLKILGPRIRGIGRDVSEHLQIADARPDHRMESQLVARD
jgi:hypothetical protein